MKKLFVLIIGLLLLTSCGSEKKDKRIKIGIAQLVEHPFLDKATEGIKEALIDNGYDANKIDLEFQNAQGDFGTAQAIASSFVQDKKDLILTVTTLSGQTMYNATKEIPLIMTAVQDFKLAGLTGENITGTTNGLNVEEVVNATKKLLPNLKVIGVAYNTSEANSESQVNQLKAICEKNGFILKEKGFTKIDEISPAIDTLLPEIDVLYTPTDNMLVLSINNILEKANKAKVPVVGCMDSKEKPGVLIIQTLDYKKLGYRTGEIGIEVLKGKKPNSIPIEIPKGTEIIINKKVATSLGIKINPNLNFKNNVIIK
ncbi:MAG: ABC transporter substrate-binding protein [Fusobacterium sp.]